MPRSRFVHGRDARPGRGCICCALTLAIALAVSGISLRAESGTIPAAPPGVVDTGAPSFVVFGQDSLGFSSPPSDFHLLPDGRVLVVSQREIAIGDGVRWETYQEAADQNGYIFSQVAVDDDGRIYAGSSGGIARIDLGEDARWRLVPVVSSPLADPFRFVAQFPDTWLWYSGGGSILAWRPGQPVQTSELSRPIKHVFAVGKERFASAGDSGQLFRLHLGGNAELIPPARTSISDTVTCSMGFGPDEILVGTVGSGIRAFDGRSFSTVNAPKILKSKQRIDALCRLGTDSYAATVDTTGIVVFDRDGRIVQVLNRALDHRLARAQRLLFSPTGVLWALLDNAVACMQFPSSVSHFEPILAGAMDYSRPLRHDGVLWVLTDGQLRRGVYAPDGYLDHFENDSPPGGFIWAVSETEGRLFATNEEGIFLRDTTGWIQIASGIVNARVGIGRARPDGRLLYLARGEIGWIRETSGRYDVERIPVKGLGEVFNAVEDAAGAIWLELGINRAGRVEFGAGPPTVRFFGKGDGLIEGWPNLFILDEKLECSEGGHLLEFDASSQRFEESRDLTRRIPALVDCVGRPTRDAAGRLWFSYHGTVCFADDTKVRENPPLVSLPLGFEATEYNMESGGIVWMQSKGHLIRFDPGMYHLPPVPLRAQITSVLLATSDHHLFNLGPTLPAIPYSDNSLVVRFAAVSSPFDPPVSFDVRLDGANDRWVSTGNAGSASFNRLKEGRYVFHVRPVRNGEPGEEALLAFTVLPPWFRTKLAWVTYLIAAAGLVLLFASIISFLQRREMVRLERLVVERTAELHYTNTRLGRQVAETVEKTTALGASEERYRRLNTELESRVALRTEELSTTNENLKREIAERQQAEVEKARLQEQLAHAQKMESVGRLAGGVAHDFNNMLQAILGNVGLALDNVPPGTPVHENLEEIQKSAERSAELTRQLLAFARKQTIQPKVLDLNETVAGMLKMLHRLIGEDIHLDWVPGAGVWPVKVDPSQIDQVLANLCVNARDAIAGVGKIAIATSNATLGAAEVQGHPEWVPGDYVLLSVSDNGKGMDAGTRLHLFEPFFTTKEVGKGTGLGLATVFGAVVQNQGLLGVDSAPGRGTTFKIYLPRAMTEAAAPPPESLPRSPRGTETVMLVEDEEQILNLGRRILPRYGYTVLAFSTPQAALAMAAQHSGPIDLLITDVVMPGMNGKELRDQLCVTHPKLKCLFMSGYTADVIASNGVLAEGIHFIQKPFTVDQLVETVRSVCKAD